MIIRDTETGPEIVDPAELSTLELLTFTGDPDCRAELLRRAETIHGSTHPFHLPGKHNQKDHAGGGHGPAAGSPGKGESGGSAGGSAFSEEQFKSLKPTSGEYDPVRSMEVMRSLGVVPPPGVKAKDFTKHEEGVRLYDQAQAFQDDPGRAKQIRRNVNDRLQGKDLGAADANKDADVMIDALRHVPSSIAPPTLYRGMGMSQSRAEVLAQYKPGTRYQAGMSSYTTDPATTGYFRMQGKAGATPVTVELTGGGKKAIPLQDIGRSDLHHEKEWVSAGEYEVTKVVESPAEIRIHARQVASI